VFKIVIKNEKGIGLIEVLVALAILGIVAAAFLSGLATAAKAIYIADVRTTAESLARSQIEYVKNQEYIPVLEGADEVTYQKINGIPAGYTIESVDHTGTTVGDIKGVPWDSDDGEAEDNEVGLQRIKLVIKHSGNVKITLEDYKVNR